MQQITAWVVAVTLICSLFIMNFQELGNAAEKRRAKQELNLAGKKITRHLSVNEDGCQIDGDAFVRDVKADLRQEGFLGCVFVYENKIEGLSAEGRQTDILFYTSEQMGQLPDLVNRIANTLVDSSSAGLEIEIALQEEWHSLRREFFQPIDGITVFLIAQGKNYDIVSGYALQFLP